MSELKVIDFSPEELTLLRDRFHALGEVTPFTNAPKLCSLIASYGIAREIGTINDELARFIFNVDTGEPVALSSLRADMIEWRGLTGIRVTSSESPRLELRTKGFYDLIHPGLSTNADQTLYGLHIFPEIIARIAQEEGVELVIIKSWGVNSIFGGFDPAKSYYQTNLWEIENNDVLKFSDLVRNGQVALLGTHDLIAHIGGIDERHWPELRQTAQTVFLAVEAYFLSTANPSIAALILPYTIGVVLDDLAQPPSYGSEGHKAVLSELLHQLSEQIIPPNLKTLLTAFPKSFQNIIDLSRRTGIENDTHLIKSTIDRMINEIQGASLTTSGQISN